VVSCFLYTVLYKYVQMCHSHCRVVTSFEFSGVAVSLLGGWWSSKSDKRLFLYRMLVYMFGCTNIRDTRCFVQFEIQEVFRRYIRVYLLSKFRSKSLRAWIVALYRYFLDSHIHRRLARFFVPVLVLTTVVPACCTEE
jgi:hypothetical protein